MGEPPWPAPAKNVVVGRRWKYAPPAWVIYEAIVNDMPRWFLLRDGDRKPEISASHRPDAVLLTPWVDPVVDSVELRIENHESGSAMTVLAYADVPELSDDDRRRVRYGLGTAFGGALREWVDEPHW